MNNGNEPAMPLTGNAYEDFAGYDGTKNTSYNPQCQGLTKREQFAAMAMQGLISSWGAHDVTDCDEIASDAVMMADALLSQLEKAK